MGLYDIGSFAYFSRSRKPDPHHLAVLTRPGHVRAAPTLPGTSRIGLPPAPPCLLRRNQRRRSFTSPRLDSAARRTKPALNAFAVTFNGRITPTGS